MHSHIHGNSGGDEGGGGVDGAGGCAGVGSVGGGVGGSGGGGGGGGSRGSFGGGGGNGGAMVHRSTVSSIMIPVEVNWVSVKGLQRWPLQQAMASEHLAASGVHGGGGCGEGGLNSGDGGGWGGAGGGGGCGLGGGGPLESTYGGGYSAVPPLAVLKESGTEPPSSSLGLDAKRKSSSTAAMASMAVHRRPPTVHPAALGSTPMPLSVSSSSSLCAADGTAVAGTTGTNTVFGITLGVGAGVGLRAPPPSAAGHGGPRRQPLKVRPSSAMDHPM